MVHDQRKNGASLPLRWCTVAAGVVHSHRAVGLLDDALALSHRFAFNLDGVRIINDSVANGVGQI